MGLFLFKKNNGGGGGHHTKACGQSNSRYSGYIFFRKTSGTIDVIGGQTATISRVEGRRRHNLEGNNIQVQMK